MALDQINQYPISAANIGDNSFIDVDQYISPGVYESQKVPTSVLDAHITAVAGGGGICGMSDSSGVFTYYATLTLALASAVSGDVIEIFADIEETGTVEINLKDGVNINGNGHSYTLNVATAENSFQDNNVAVDCSIFNLKIIRDGAGYSPGTSLALFIDNPSTNIKLFGVHLFCSANIVCLNHGTITGGYFESVSYWGMYNLNGNVYNVKFYSASSIAVRSDSGTLNNCTAVSDGSNAILLVNGGYAFSCSGYSTASSAISISVNSKAQGCFGRSTGGSGIQTTHLNATVTGCKAISTSSYGFFGITNGDVDSTHCYSTGSYGAVIQGNGRATGCTFISTVADAVYLSGTLLNCTARSLLNTSSGDAVYIVGTACEVFNCSLETTHASANGLRGISAKTVKYGSNVFKGMTLEVNANITQGQTLVPDTYGNILIG